MKNFLIILLCILANQCFAQEDTNVIPSPPELPPIITSCDSISDIAKTDYDNGKRQYTIMGMVELDDFQLFYNDYMESKYNIDIRANCMPQFLDDCYNAGMMTRIEEQYGVNFITNSYEEARKEFNKTQIDH